MAATAPGGVDNDMKQHENICRHAYLTTNAKYALAVRPLLCYVWGMNTRQTVFYRSPEVVGAEGLEGGRRDVVAGEAGLGGDLLAPVLYKPQQHSQHPLLRAKRDMRCVQGTVQQ